jgi:hypothetical protein
MMHSGSNTHHILAKGTLIKFLPRDQEEQAGKHSLHGCKLLAAWPWQWR